MHYHSDRIAMLSSKVCMHAYESIIIIYTLHVGDGRCKNRRLVNLYNTEESLHVAMDVMNLGIRWQACYPTLNGSYPTRMRKG